MRLGEHSCVECGGKSVMSVRSIVATTIALIGTISAAFASEAASESGLPEQSVAGSYDILICTGTCDATGDKNVQVTGKLVLFPATLQQQDLDREHLSGSFMGGDP